MAQPTASDPSRLQHHRNLTAPSPRHYRRPQHLIRRIKLIFFEKAKLCRKSAGSICFSSYPHILVKKSQACSSASSSNLASFSNAAKSALLQEAAKLHCSSSRGKSNPRMLKRRNSPYSSFNLKNRGTTCSNFKREPHESKPLGKNSKFAVFYVK